MAIRNKQFRGFLHSFFYMKGDLKSSYPVISPTFKHISRTYHGIITDCIRGESDFNYLQP